VLAPVIIISIAGILQVYLGWGCPDHMIITCLLQVVIDIIVKNNVYFRKIPGSGEPPIYTGE